MKNFINIDKNPKQKMALSIVVIVILLLGGYYIFSYSAEPKELPFPPSKYPAEDGELPNEGDYYDRGNEIDSRAVIKQFFAAVGQDFSIIENEFVMIEVKGREIYANSPIKDEIDEYINGFAVHLYLTAYTSYYSGARFDPPFSFAAEVGHYVKHDGYISLIVNLWEYSGGAHGHAWTYIQVTDKKGNVVTLEEYIAGKISTENLIEKINEEISKHPYEESITRVSEFDNPSWAVTETGGLRFIYDPYELASYAVGKIVIDIDL